MLRDLTPTSQIPPTVEKAPGNAVNDAKGPQSGMHSMIRTIGMSVLFVLALGLMMAAYASVPV